MKKPTQKVAYLSRNSVVSEIFYQSPFSAQQPKWQNSCSQMWLKKQLYIELGFIPYHYLEVLYCSWEYKNNCKFISYNCMMERKSVQVLNKHFDTRA